MGFTSNFFPQVFSLQGDDEDDVDEINIFELDSMAAYDFPGEGN